MARPKGGKTRIKETPPTEEPQKKKRAPSAPLWDIGDIVEITYKEIQAEVVRIHPKKLITPFYFNDGEKEEDSQQVESFIYELNELSTLTGKKMGRVHFNAEFELRDVKKIKIRVVCGRPKKEKKTRRRRD